jgi:hypothetical protein
MEVALRKFVAALMTLAAPAVFARAEPPVAYQSWETFTTRDGLPHDAVLSLLVYGPQVWVGTARGLALHEDGRWRAWTHTDPQNSVPLPPISALARDANTGDLWLGTWGRGLLRFSAGRFDRFDQLNSGLAGNMVFAVLVVDGRVWAATNGGLSVFNPRGDQWDLLVERRASGPELPLLGLVRDADDAGVYAAAWCAGLYRIDTPHGAASAVPLPWDAARDTTLTVVQADDTTWWVTQTCLARRASSGSWELRDMARLRTPGAFIACAAARSPTEIWLGTNDGLRVLADWFGETWVTYRRNDVDATTLVAVARANETLESHVLSSGLPDNRIHCLTFQGNDVWVGTAHGLAHGRRARELSARRQRNAPPEVRPDHRSSPNPSSPSIAVLSQTSRTMALPGASDGAAPFAGSAAAPDVSAVQLAVEEANARGGYRGTVPFELVIDPSTYARYGWVLPEDDFATLGGVLQVSGIVGCVGPDQRFTTAAAWRTGVPLVNAADQPATPDEAVNPWIFRAGSAARSDSDAETRFAARFEVRFRRAPWAGAFASYVATEYLLRAIERAGPDRDVIRRTLADMRQPAATQPARAQP